MQCPVCKTSNLRPSKIDSGLPAMACTECKGALLSLLYYRNWRETHTPEKDPSLQPETTRESNDSHSALQCPKCSRIMSRYRISGEVSNRLDVCRSCDEAWLDGGEWELLKALELSHDIPKVLADSWQHAVRQTVSENERIRRFSQILDQEDLDEAIRVHNWLKTHPKRRDILAFISHE